MNLLNIVSSGYRATVEEQDDTVVWISHAIRNADADVDLLLCGSAANYSVKGQSVEPIMLGGRTQKHAPDVHGQVRKLLEAGSRVFAVSDELEARGIDSSQLLEDVQLVRADELPGLLNGYDHVWHW